METLSQHYYKKGPVMEPPRHKDYSRKEFIEEVRILRESVYWPYLQSKTQEDILVLLTEYAGENFEES